MKRNGWPKETAAGTVSPAALASRPLPRKIPQPKSLSHEWPEASNAGGTAPMSRKKAKRGGRGSIPPAVRRAVRERDRGCVAARFPGLAHISCVGGTQCHHLWRKSQGGPNTVDNLKLLCAAHHLWVHEHPSAARRLDLLRIGGDLDGSLTRARSGMVEP